MISQRRIQIQTAVLAASFGLFATLATAQTDPPFWPRLVTDQTLADPAALAALEQPGQVIFEDGFESDESLKKYFEIRGGREGNVQIVADPQLAHSGHGAIRFTAVERGGRESGVGATAWLGAEGYERLYFRRYLRFAADYDQGPLHHVGGGLSGVAGSDRWRAMGTAGRRPTGDDHFKSAFEPWRDWGRYEPPGYMFLYTYWMDMKRDRDGNYWGNMLGPAPEQRIVLQRDRWYCLEHMIQTNRPGQADGELAAWIDGQLYLHYQGVRWRTSADVKLKRFGIGLYVHRANRDNTVWYDDVAVSTGYIGLK